MNKPGLFRLPLVIFFAALAALILSRFAINYYQAHFSGKGRAVDPQVEQIFTSLFRVLEEAESGKRDPGDSMVQKTREYFSHISGIRPASPSGGEALKQWRAWYKENCGYFYYDMEKNRITCPFLKRSVPAPDFLIE
jgi:hypothetical protein